MKKLYKTLPFIPLYFFYIFNSFKYKLLYRNSEYISPKWFSKKSKIWNNVSIWWWNCLINSNIWDYTYINSYLDWIFSNNINSIFNNVRIWKFCSIWQNIEIIWWAHKKNITNYPILSKLDIKNIADDHIYYKTIIWNDVLIWSNSKILWNINIWDWAIIWMWAVVTKDVPPYAIVWWVPAKIISYRYEQQIINKLLKINWWDWSIDKIKENINFFSSNNIEDFIITFYKEDENSSNINSKLE